MLSLFPAAGPCMSRGRDCGASLARAERTHLASGAPNAGSVFAAASRAWRAARSKGNAAAQRGSSTRAVRGGARRFARGRLAATVKEKYTIDADVSDYLSFLLIDIELPGQRAQIASVPRRLDAVIQRSERYQDWRSEPASASRFRSG